MQELNVVDFNSLELKFNNQVKPIDVNGKKIEVQQYLPVEEKLSLVSVSLQRSLEGGVYNSIKKDIFFHLNLIFMYTNILFTEEERKDPFVLYDKLDSNNIINKVVDVIPDTEYDFLVKSMEEQEVALIKYQTSVAGILDNFITMLPAQAQAAADIVENFDKDKYLEVIDFAKSVGFSK